MGQNGAAASATGVDSAIEAAAAERPPAERCGGSRDEAVRAIAVGAAGTTCNDTTAHSLQAGVVVGGACAASSSRGASEDACPPNFATAVTSFTDEVRALERRRREITHRATEMIRSRCPSARLVKATSVDGRLIIVLDGAVPAGVRAHLFECLQTDAFRRTEFARQDTREFRHHVVDYNVDKLRRTELSQIIDRLVAAFFQDADSPPLEVYRIYTNAVMFGDVAFMHRDSFDASHVTALFYPNPEWACELGGETVFYDEEGEIVEAVEPRPGRLVLFRGCIQHKGSPPSRLFWGSRYTTAFKYAVPDSPTEPPGDKEPPEPMSAPI
mmetsp:Transcript_41906/g.121143  ORF Transcript_41906/g.121143 Transcript_41906/m.121143 type:complete len:327 (-) Transcript_41906:93-1073(-)